MSELSHFELASQFLRASRSQSRKPQDAARVSDLQMPNLEAWTHDPLARVIVALLEKSPLPIGELQVRTGLSRDAIVKAIGDADESTRAHFRLVRMRQYTADALTVDPASSEATQSDFSLIAFRTPAGRRRSAAYAVSSAWRRAIGLLAPARTDAVEAGS